MWLSIGPLPGGVDTVQLCTDIVSWPELAGWPSDSGKGVWIIAEQDRADEPAEEAIADNARFRRTQLAMGCAERARWSATV